MKRACCYYFVRRLSHFESEEFIYSEVIVTLLCIVSRKHTRVKNDKFYMQYIKISDPSIHLYINKKNISL